MKIKKVQLKNGYKRFFDLTIDLGENPKKIIALVGPNGCGKSSVLDGLLFSNNRFNLIGNKSPKDYKYHSMNQTLNYGSENIDIQFLEGDFPTIWSEKRKTGDEKTIFSFRSSYRYNNNLKVTQSKATPEIRLNDYGATTAVDLDDKMEENYRRLRILYNKYLNKEDCSPSKAKSKIIGDLNSSISKCLDIEISTIGDIEDSKGTLYFKKIGHPNEFEFNVLSSGEKEVVDLLLDLYLRKEEYNDTIFLLDEPELHINTSIQKNLLLEINRLVGENCQIWITTHSIGILKTLQEELKEKCQVIEFNNTSNLASEKRILTPMQSSWKKWKDIFEIAIDDLAHLVLPRRIIYCEGRDKPDNNGEERGLDAQVFNNIFTEKYHDTLFVSSGGNTELDQRSEIAFIILSKVSSKIEINVLKDRDMASGKDTSEEDRLLYLENNLDNHRVLKRWEIENYLYDKEVLKKYCSKNSLEFKEPAYDESVKNIEDDHVKDNTGRIRNFCNIVGSISPKKFKLLLSKYISEDMAVYKALELCIFGKE